MIKIIAFDMWQTLGTYKFNLYEEVLRVSGLGMSLKEFILLKGKIKVSPYLNDIESFVEKINKMGVNDKEVLEKIRGLYLKAHNSIFLYEDTLDSLLKLKQKGKILALITNVDSYAHKKIISLFPKKFFDFVLASFELDLRKPDKRLFLKLTEKYSVRPEEILMVGDSEELDIKPAKELNWKTAFINRGGEKSVFADYNITSLGDLLNIV